MEKEIQNIGLTNIETKVYLALVELKQALPGEISRQSGVHRRTVYKALKGLQKKELVFVENKVYKVKNPEKLLEIIQKQKNEMMEIYPMLKAKYDDSKNTQVTNFFKGNEGLKTLFDDEIIEGKEILVMGSRLKDNSQTIAAVERFEKRRVAKKIPMRIILTSRKQKVSARSGIKVRYLPEQYGVATTTNIYGNKTAIILLTGNILIIHMQISDVTESFKNYFELLWKLAKP